MQINLTGHHVDITPALRDYVTTKVERLERHCDVVQNTQVVLEVEKQAHRAEATVHVSGGRVFAESSQSDMYAAIDTLVDKLDRQLKRHKEKMTNHHRAEGGLKALES